MSKNNHRIYTERKIFVIGGVNSYACWLQGVIVKDIREANLVVIIGGADWGSKYYNQPDIGHYVGDFPESDAWEMGWIQLAIKLNKKIIGICRGAQILPCLVGGSIFQHVRHSYNHFIETYDGQKLETNSLHHQLACLDNVKPEDYKLLAWANPSPFHMNGWDQDVPQERDAEIVFYPTIGGGALGIQGHPEMMCKTKWYEDTVNWCQNQLNLFMEDKLK